MSEMFKMFEQNERKRQALRHSQFSPNEWSAIQPLGIFIHDGSKMVAKMALDRGLQTAKENARLVEHSKQLLEASEDLLDGLASGMRLCDLAPLMKRLANIQGAIRY